MQSDYTNPEQDTDHTPHVYESITETPPIYQTIDETGQPHTLKHKQPGYENTSRAIREGIYPNRKVDNLYMTPTE